MASNAILPDGLGRKAIVWGTIAGAAVADKQWSVAMAAALALSGFNLLDKVADSRFE